MKQILFVFLLAISSNLLAQEIPTKWQGHFSVGQYTAGLTPTFNPLHLGFNTGVFYQWNNHEKHQLIQSGNLAYFYHKNLQMAIQLYTELGYQFKFDNGLKITPFSIGGGYVLSVLDLTTLKWDETTEQYTVDKFPARNNWVFSLGASLGYESKLMLANRPLSFFADYRLQIQGVLMENSIPLIAYVPIRLGISLPLAD